MTIERFKNLVIGSGVAGKLLAWTLASQDQKTVDVERAMFGGSCPNVACLPSGGQRVGLQSNATFVLLPQRVGLQSIEPQDEFGLL
jgi:pyruvate/2-oxoglutarate dehydrogenase complex dihydrolipoamide dehydrogenase (E3) component